VTDVPVPESGRPQHAAGPAPHGSPLSPGGYPAAAASANPSPVPPGGDRRLSAQAVPTVPPAGGPPAPPTGWPQVPSAWQGLASAPPASGPPSSGAPWRALAPADLRPTSAPFGHAQFSAGPSDTSKASRRSQSLRPIYREPLPARPGSVVIGALAGALWMLLFGLLGHNARSYCWWTVGAALAGWGAAVVLARSGDRGIAAGAAMSSGVGLAIAMSVVVTHWVGGHWLLW
jgi:hypothetical protein